MTEVGATEPARSQRPDANAAAPSPRPLGFWATVAWGVLAIVVWIAAQFAVVFLVWWAAARRAEPFDLERVDHDLYLLTLALGVSMLLQIGVLALAVRLARWPLAGYFAIHRPRLRDFARGACYLAVLLTALDLLTYSLGRDILPSFVRDIYLEARNSGTLPLLFLLLVVVAPLGEEITFRGFLFRGLAASFLGPVATILITSAAFTALHVQYDWYGRLQVFSLGLLLGWLRWRSGSTTLTILLHALVNFTVIVEAMVIIERP